MPALFAPALDLAALTAVLVALALVYLAYKIAQSVAGVLNFSILGVHPLANVSRALENSIVTWLSSAVTELESIARDLFHGLVWAWGELLDGINAMATHTEDALALLWGSSIPHYVKAALNPYGLLINAADAAVKALERTVAKEVNRLDAKVESTGRAISETLTRTITREFDRDIATVQADVRGIKSSVDQAIEHALSLARSESQTAVGELRGVEEAAIGAIRSAEGATAEELRNLIRDLNPAQVTGLIAAVPLLATLVQTIAAESGLDSAECRSKVKNICGTNSGDWSWLLTGAGVLGFGMSLREIIDAGREVVSYVAAGAEDLAELG